MFQSNVHIEAGSESELIGDLDLPDSKWTSTEEVKALGPSIFRSRGSGTTYFRDQFASTVFQTVVTELY